MKQFIFLLILVALVACAPNEGNKIKDDGTYEPSTKPVLKIKDFFQANSIGCRFILEDTETGVEYICVQNGSGFGITPRIGKTTPKVER